MGNNIKTIVYLTTNKNNDKIYIGVHDTDPDIYDYYIGGGIYANKPSSANNQDDLFHRAVRKHGVKAFEREIIAIFNTRKEALNLEKLLVNEAFLKRNDVYNTCIGGGDPPTNAIKVYMYDLDGNFIKEFESILYASNYVGAADSGCIHSAIKNKTISFDHYWTKEKLDVINPNDFITKLQRKQVYEYNENGKYITAFNSLSETCRNKNITLGVLQRGIKGKTKVRGSYFSLDRYETFPIKNINRYEHRGKPVYQYDLNGKFVQEWKNTSEVIKQLGDTYKLVATSINLQKTCGNYQWSWNKIEAMPPAIITKAKQVGQYTLDGKLIKIWNTVRECRKEFGNVSKVLRGYVNQTKGFTFKYI